MNLVDETRLKYSKIFIIEQQPEIINYYMRIYKNLNTKTIIATYSSNNNVHIKIFYSKANININNVRISNMGVNAHDKNNTAKKISKNINNISVGLLNKVNKANKRKLYTTDKDGVDKSNKKVEIILNNIGQRKTNRANMNINKKACTRVNANIDNRQIINSNKIID